MLADIPGLIEGASEGVGLGLKFLAHVERCGVLLHLIDGTQEDVVDAYRTIRKEIKQYSKVLAGKTRELVALNKCDALSEDEDKKKNPPRSKSQPQKDPGRYRASPARA